MMFFRELPRFMRQRGYDTEVVSSPGDELAQYARSEDVSAHAIAMERRITVLADLRSTAALIRLFRSKRPEIVHAHTPKAGLLAMIAAWTARVPVRIYHVHGLPFMSRSGLSRALLWATERVACALSSSVLCVSPSIREVLVRSRLCPAHKAKVLLRGTISGVDATGTFRPLPDTARAAARTRLGIPPGALVVGFVGRVVRDKGIVDLAEAWLTVRNNHPDAHLVIVGPVEQQDPIPESLLERLRADPRVHMAGLQLDMPPLYSAMDLVVLPSYREGFGLAALEGGAMELPVVATRIPGLVDAVQDGVTGTLVPPRDPPRLAAAIEHYLADDEMREAHGRAGRERALADFDRQSVWSALADEYDHLIERPR
jgi:glycosyltransferase involved in cell wall biosynthesis